MWMWNYFDSIWFLNVTMCDEWSSVFVFNEMSIVKILDADVSLDVSVNKYFGRCKIDTRMNINNMFQIFDNLIKIFFIFFIVFSSLCCNVCVCWAFWQNFTTLNYFCVWTSMLSFWNFRFENFVFLMTNMNIIWTFNFWNFDAWITWMMNNNLE